MSSKGSRIFDRAELKREFLTSDFLTVVEFCRYKTGKKRVDGVWSVNAKGWAEEKQKWQKMKQEELTKAVVAETKKSAKISAKVLIAQKTAAFALINRKLKILQGMSERTFKNVAVSEITGLLKMIKTELGESTQIVHDVTGQMEREAEERRAREKDLKDELDEEDELNSKRGPVG